MWFGLENMLVSYADDATLLAVVPSPAARLDVSDSLIGTWRKSVLGVEIGEC